MKRVTVTPLREIDGVKFGETRATVRRSYGTYTESGNCDDFKWCKAYYDKNNKLESVVLNMNECTLILNSTNVDNTNITSARRGLGIFNGHIDKSRGILFSESANKVNGIAFTKNSDVIVEKGKQVKLADGTTKDLEDHINKCSNVVSIFDIDKQVKSSDKKDVKNEAVGDDYEKDLTDLVGEDEAKKQIDAEAQERDNYINALQKAKESRPASSVIGTPKEEEGTLSQFYDDLKTQLNSNPADASMGGIKVGPPMSMMHHHPGHHSFMHMARNQCDALKDKCCKHILLDVYCKVHPMDQEFVQGNMGMMKADIDNMLDAKGMTASQYLTSCGEATGAPLLKFIMNSIDRIGTQFMEAEKAKLKDAEENEAEVSTPEAPDPEEDVEINSQLVDVKKDTEYENFIDKLKEKTIKKIVTDVSKIITDKKEENEMEFDPKPQATDAALESTTTSVALDYIQEQFMKAGVGISDEHMDDVIGMAIREATLNEINTCFKQPETDLRRYTTRIRMGKGYVINESAISSFVESAK